jgi:putative spermidine/putrescine transport system substrate-binding protein
MALAMPAGCGGDDDTSGADTGTAPAAAGDWAAVRAEAQGQTVRWWMYGGDARINAYVNRHVKPAARRAGVTLEIVPIEDTADAVQRVLAEREAGKTDGGAVDLIWINGENFAQGKEAGLWLEDWAGNLPNARFLDPEDPSITTDFGVPVEGQESPWSRAAFVFAHDSARVTDPPRSFEELLAYARANPGRVTYPAPPDFTGSAFVRLAVQSLGEDEAMALLTELKPLMYREGRSLPKSEAELTRLFGDGQVDLAMSYDPAFVNGGVNSGQMPRTARPLAFGRTLTNVSYVAIPANAANTAGAQVVADLLLSPRLQAVKADPDVLGSPSVLDASRLRPADRRALTTAGGDSPYLLGPEELGTPLAELPAADVPRLEARWKREVLR